MYQKSDLEELNLQQVEWLEERQQQALTSAVEQHETWLANRANARANLRMVREYLEERREAAAMIAASATVTDKPFGSTAEANRRELDDAGEAIPLNSELASDDLPFDNAEMDAAAEEEAESTEE